jgi:hypothetical protein
MGRKVWSKEKSLQDPPHGFTIRVVSPSLAFGMTRCAGTLRAKTFPDL